MELLLFNGGLFLLVAVAGLVASWFGWRLASQASDDSGHRGGGSGVRPHPIVLFPAGDCGSTKIESLDDLARSA